MFYCGGLFVLLLENIEPQLRDDQLGLKYYSLHWNLYFHFENYIYNSQEVFILSYFFFYQPITTFVFVVLCFVCFTNSEDASQKLQFPFSKLVLLSPSSETFLVYLGPRFMILSFLTYVLQLISYTPYFESSQTNLLFRKPFSGNEQCRSRDGCIFGHEGLRGALNFWLLCLKNFQGSLETYYSDYSNLHSGFYSYYGVLCYVFYELFSSSFQCYVLSILKNFLNHNSKLT